MKRFFTSAIFVLTITLMFSPAYADVITVCSSGCDYDIIEEALNNADTGDTVLVKDGTYEENIIWPSRDGIILQSENGPENCTIDGGWRDDRENCNGPTICIGTECYKGEERFAEITTATVIDGFTIMGGCEEGAGGIKLRETSPLITNCIITQNVAIDGAGISCRWGAPEIKK